MKMKHEDKREMRVMSFGPPKIKNTIIDVTIDTTLQGCAAHEVQGVHTPPLLENFAFFAAKMLYFI